MTQGAGDYAVHLLDEKCLTKNFHVCRSCYLTVRMIAEIVADGKVTAKKGSLLIEKRRINVMLEFKRNNPIDSSQTLWLHQKIWEGVHI